MNTVTIHDTVVLEADQKTDTQPDAAVTEAVQLRQRTNDLFTLEGTATENRARLHFDIFHYVEKYGRERVETLAADNDYSTTSEALDCHLLAQFLTGINVYEKNIGPKEKGKRQTRVRPFAKVLEVLRVRRDEHTHFDFDDWLKWYLQEQQQQGLIKSLQTSSITGRKSNDNGPSPDSLVEEAFGSPAAVTLASDLHLPDLVPGRPMLVMVRQDEIGVRAVPLPKAGSNALASVAGYRATGLENAPAALRFWHLLMSVGTAIIPDATSDEPVSPLEPDDEPNAATPMLPAYATYLWDSGKFTVASARSHDTLIVEVVPREGVDLGISAGALRFMDKRTRNTMTERLLQPSVCAGYGEDKGISVVADGDAVSVKFLHTEKKLNGQLKFPPIAKFGTNWTSRVNNEFDPSADAVMDEAEVVEFSSTFLNMLASKAKSDAEVSVSISKGKIAFKRDRAAKIGFTADVQGSTTVRVMQSDLLAVVPSLLSLERVGGIAWELAPEGLLMVKVWTKEAVVCAYVQTLEEGRETRSRKLLERVRAPQQIAPIASGKPTLAE